ncbi:hypothetical protein [Cellulosimicrobium arenosum]|uniref:Uncharacterized protein n=1 Tax=Cellulosimicrobium arenosum TaxID=2708133 RepID=A0A927G5T2_9MICO|nr:hypothetical protein [Cellulosimicrobium arenosum]MBD8077534.1 hypothetical protein [Cellulosimicrobium arenosum]
MSATSRRVPRRALLRYALIALAVMTVVLANVVLQRAGAMGETDQDTASPSATAASG